MKARQGHTKNVCKISGSNSQKRRGHWHLKEFRVLCLNQPVFLLLSSQETALSTAYSQPLRTYGNLSFSTQHQHTSYRVQKARTPVTCFAVCTRAGCRLPAIRISRFLLAKVNGQRQRRRRCFFKERESVDAFSPALKYRYPEDCRWGSRAQKRVPEYTRVTHHAASIYAALLT